MCEFFGGLLVELYILRRNTERLYPFHKGVEPFLMKLSNLVRTHEIFDLHLLEFPCTEDKIPGCNFVSKSLPDLRDAEWKLSTRCVEHIFEVNKDPLRGLRPKVGKRSRIVIRRNSSDRCAEHQVKGTRFGQIRRTAVRANELARFVLFELVLAKTRFAGTAVNERI